MHKPQLSRIKYGRFVRPYNPGGRKLRFPALSHLGPFPGAEPGTHKIATLVYIKEQAASDAVPYRLRVGEILGKDVADARS